MQFVEAILAGETGGFIVYKIKKNSFKNIFFKIFYSFPKVANLAFLPVYFK